MAEQFETVDEAPAGSFLAEIEADVEAQLAQPKAAEPAPLTQADITSQAMLRIAQAMEARMAREESVRQIPITEIKPVTPWNPEGKKNRREFSRATFLNDVMLNPMTHSEAEMALFNKLKPGRYLNRRLEVQKNANGEINVVWNGKTLDKRMSFYSEFPSITLLLNAILKEREDKLAKRRANIIDDDDDLM